MLSASGPKFSAFLFVSYKSHRNVFQHQFQAISTSFDLQQCWRLSSDAFVLQGDKLPLNVLQQHLRSIYAVYTKSHLKEPI